jgi:hypothetical protein
VRDDHAAIGVDPCGATLNQCGPIIPANVAAGRSGGDADQLEELVPYMGEAAGLQHQCWLPPGGITAHCSHHTGRPAGCLPSWRDVCGDARLASRVKEGTARQRHR